MVADLQAHLDEDIYRFGYPRDLTGQNLFKATIVRLLNYQNLYPGQFSDVINFSLAQCYERLGNFEKAIQHYDTVRLIDDSPLAELAEQNLEIATEFHSATEQNYQLDSLSDYILDVESRIAKLDKLTIKYRDSFYQILARKEKEQLLVEFAHILKESRYALPDGPQRSINAFQLLIDENPESIRKFEHRLQLADFYYELASEYAAINHPERGDFFAQTFDNFIELAINIYYEVAQADGYLEKIEAKFKLISIQEFERRIRQKSK
jgi:hypothetical protein